MEAASPIFNRGGGPPSKRAAGDHQHQPLSPGYSAGRQLHARCRQPLSCLPSRRPAHPPDAASASGPFLDLATTVIHRPSRPIISPVERRHRGPKLNPSSATVFELQHGVL
ncbi:hypothetical protein ACQJBY_042760 [Aegilops geniculata]